MKVYRVPMAPTMRIAEVADRTGFSAAALRYYEQLDLLPPPTRTAAGYRAYDESVLTRLAFIARAKTLGCTLDEVAALMPLWDGGRCAPVQDRLRDLVTAKLGDARAQVAALAAFRTDLERILAGLDAHTPDGPCDPDCGCLTDPPAPAAAAEPVACTLDLVDVAGRLEEWRDLLTHVVDRAAIDGGTRLRLDAAVPLDRVASLVEAEHGCCGFFAFAITVDSRGVALEVRAPAAGQAMVDALFGGPAAVPTPPQATLKVPFMPES
jgi:DNA-binding transcriptional MerR regulator